MMCFWKFGHKWEEASEKQATKIKESLEMFGIHSDKIEICSKCHKIKLTASTFIEAKPKIRILPPYPFESDDEK
jgi:hypothetical protein